MQHLLWGLRVFCYATAIVEEKSSYILNLFWPSGHQLFNFRCLGFNKLSCTGEQIQQLMWVICHLQPEYDRKENQSYFMNLVVTRWKAFASFYVCALHNRSIFRSILDSVLLLLIARHLLASLWGCHLPPITPNEMLWVLSKLHAIKNIYSELKECVTQYHSHYEDVTIQVLSKAGYISIASPSQSKQQPLSAPIDLWAQYLVTWRHLYANNTTLAVNRELSLDMLCLPCILETL